MKIIKFLQKIGMLKYKGVNMSFENEILMSVKNIVEASKSTVMQNLVHAIRMKNITIDESKLPGLDLIIRSSIDQAFANSAKGLNDVLKKMSSKMK